MSCPAMLPLLRRGMKGKCKSMFRFIPQYFLLCMAAAGLCQTQALMPFASGFS
jgi:hypothetical protein